MLVLKLVWHTHTKKKKQGGNPQVASFSLNVLGRGMSIYRQGRHMQNDGYRPQHSRLSS